MIHDHDPLDQGPTPHARPVSAKPVPASQGPTGTAADRRSGRSPRSPVSNVLGLVTAEPSTARTPAGGRDTTAPLGVAAVELDEVSTAPADVDRVRIHGRPASAAIDRVGRWSAGRSGSWDRDRTSPRAAHHDRSVPRYGLIVDRADRTVRTDRTGRHGTGARFRTSWCTRPARSS